MINIKHLTNNLQAVHNGRLSQKLSVTPQRHGGFFAPKIRADFGAMAVYGWMTLQNNPLGQYAGRFLTTESESSHPNTSQVLVVFSIKVKAI